MSQTFVGVRSRLLGLCLYIFLFLTMGQALLQSQQNTTAALKGTVLDPAGRAVVSASVTAKNESSGAVSKSATDAQGTFSFNGLAAGRYTIEVSGRTFHPIEPWQRDPGNYR